MAKPPLPAHILTTDEIDALVVEKVAADGMITVRDANGNLVQVRIAVKDVGGTWTIVGVGPGSS